MEWQPGDKKPAENNAADKGSSTTWVTGWHVTSLSTEMRVCVWIAVTPHSLPTRQLESRALGNSTH